MNLLDKLFSSTIVSMAPIVLSLALASTNASAENCDALLNYESERLHSAETVNLCERFNDKKVLLFVNTASQCGFTPQFAQLESLYQKYKHQGLEIIGFPSNDFNQEYSSEEKAASICYENYGVTFTMFKPSSVKGQQANAVFKALAERTGRAPSWNFNKYLVNTIDKQAINYFGSTVKPLNSQLEREIAELLL